MCAPELPEAFPCAADELERYLQKTPNAKNADALRDAVKKLRSQAAEAKTSSP